MNKHLFLKSVVAATLALLSTGMKAQDPLQFAVLSDVHFDDGTGGGANVRTPIALQNLTDHGDLDALVVVGDLTQTGAADEFAMFRDCFLNDDNYYCPNIFELIVMMGNHDNSKGLAQAFMDTLSVFNYGEPYPLDTYRVIKGYPFISISMHSSANSDWGNTSAGLNAYPRSSTDFLKEALAQAVDDCPGMPIFVFTHVPPRYTCYCSWPELEGVDWSMNVMNSILNQYPQVVLFAGHSHYPVGDPRSIHQGVNPNSSRQNYYTVVNTGTTSYSEISTPTVDEGVHPLGYADVNEGLIVRETEDGDIEIIRLDTRRNVEIDPEHRWVLKAPFDGSQFCYGDVRDADDNPNGVALRDGLPAPTFGDSQLDVQPSAFSATINIPQATDENCVFCYHVKVSTEGATVKEGAVFSQFYLNSDMPETITYKVYNLKPGRTYDVEVTALDSYENASTALTATFVTEGSTKPEDQVPAAAGLWNFDDPENPMACSEGTLSLRPVNCDGGMTERESIDEAGIEWCNGMEEGDGALRLPQNAGFYMPLDLEEATNTYTIKWDIYFSSSNYNSFLQTTLDNTDDTDLCTHNGKIGIGTVGYHGSIQNNTWSRVVMINNGGKGTLYIDGVLAFENKECSRWDIDPAGVLFFCDDDGERVETMVTSIAFWDIALTESQVFNLGLMGTADYLNIQSSNVKISDNTLDFTVKVNTSVPVRFVLPEWVEAVDVQPVIGTKSYAFRCQPMDGAGSREGEIIATSSYNLSDTIQIKQESFGGKLPDAFATWTFDDAGNLMATIGDAVMEPAYFEEEDYLSGVPVLATTPDEAGITVVDGPADGNGAIYLPKTSCLKVTLPESFQNTKDFSFLFDIMPESLVGYNALLQPRENNDNDGVLFLLDKTIGIRTAGLGYNGELLDGQWHRILFVVRDSYASVYIDGEQVGQSTSAHSIWSLPTNTFYFFLDNDGEMVANNVAELRFWDCALSSDLVEQLGGLGAEAEIEEAPEADDVFTFDTEDIDEVLYGNGDAILLPCRPSDDTTTKEPEEADDIEAAGMSIVAGPKEGNYALRVPPYSYLLFSPEKGNTTIDTYTLMMDIKPEDLSGFKVLTQHRVNNNDDGTLFIRNNEVGHNNAGLGYSGQLQPNTWHRLVIVVNEGIITLYLDGSRLNSSTSASFWGINKYMYLFLDNDGEEGTINLAEFRYWDSALTDPQVRGLGCVEVDDHVESIIAEDKNVDNRIFDLMGRVMNADQPLPAGLYIQSGKKYLVK